MKFRAGTLSARIPRRAPCTTLSPIPPRPNTTTLAPGSTLAVLITAPMPVALKDINRAFDLMHTGESIRSVVVY